MCKCPYRGVWSVRYKRSRKGGYVAKLKHGGATVNLGYFDDAAEAGQHYDAAVRLLRGDQDPSLLNFPDGVPGAVVMKVLDMLVEKGLLSLEEPS